MKGPKPPNSVTVLVLTTITILLWVFFSVYRILTSQPDSSVPPEILEPLTPSLNTELLDSLDDRLFFTENEVVEFRTTTEETDEDESLIETQQEEASESAELSPTPPDLELEDNEEESI